MNSEKIEVKSNELDQIDFETTCLNIGVKLPRSNEPWTPLDKEDLLILAKLIRTPLPLRTAAGHMEMVRADKESKALNMLATWAEAAAAWYGR